MNRTPLKKISAKKLAQMGGRMPRSSLVASAGLKSRTGLKRNSRPMRRTRLRPVGKKGSRYPERRNRAFTDWVASLSCLIGDIECWHPSQLLAKGKLSDPAHVNKTRGSGAYDEGEVVNLCRFHHRRQEGKTAAFNKRYGVNLAAIARVLWTTYERTEIGRCL